MDMRHRWFAVGFVVVAVGGAAITAAVGPSWPQWGQNPQHTGFLNVKGQNLNRIVADIVYDPLVPKEQNLNDGDLLVHYQVPLVDGNDVYMESKAGSYSKGAYATQSWHQNRFSWVGGALTKIWTFDSDWAAPGSQSDFWEPVYHAVLANGFVYDPGLGGTIFKLNKADGSVVRRINPFETIDPNTFTVSPLTTDAFGNVYYNALKVLNGGNQFLSKDAVDSWLVKVAPDDSIQIVSYTTLLAGNVPARSDLCYATFGTSQLPWPPSANAIPGRIACGLQRVAINIAPAIAPNGTIYTVTRAHFISRYGYLVAINPDLTLQWATSLRGDDRVAGDYFSGGYFADGCGVPVSLGGWLPPNGQPNGCRDLGLDGNAATFGRDPATNRLGGGRVLDDSSSTPTIAPDGSILYGAYTRYNWAQGHMMRFSDSGQFLGAFGFGWDTTPGIYQHDGTYSIVIKNNHYSGLGSYCNDPVICPEDRDATNPESPEEFFITQLRPDLSVEWSFKNTNTLSCSRAADGSVSCVDDHPHSFEWCVNALALDRNGTVFANSEDGHLFAIAQGGLLKQKIFQQLALGAAYTPASLGGDGKVYTQNAGHLFVVSR
ncbi:MAG: hypothetical protein AUH72_20955 [Acidobacteria bacterium 13_1_40CM_4_65_8]|nr:MAG: hypothetical protein AUH72_20955 [Acidobacteria bacterium 13_1_40CM_4_65_8]